MRFDLNRVHALADRARTQMQAQQQPRARGGRSWYEIRNAAKSDGAEVYIYDMIGEWGISAQDFVNELRGVKAGSIDLHVNSEGGEVFDGLAIFEAIARHPAKVTAYVDGLAASAASFIVQAADEIQIARRAKMMIHDAHGLAYGPPRDMRSMADLLDELSDTIADIYAARAGGSRQQWRTAMQAASGGPDGSWYDAEASIAAKLADKIRGDGDTDPTGGRRAELEPAAPAEDAAVWAWNPGEFAAVFAEVEAPPPPPVLSGPELLELFRAQ